MKITKLIEKLGSLEPDGRPFLSIYINAEPGENGRDTYPIWLKTQLSEEEQKYKEDEANLGRFNEVRDQINSFVDDEADAGANGIAIFAGFGEDEFFEVVQLDVAFPESTFHSNVRPHIFPLARAVYENPRYAVVWADTNKADIYIFGGETRIRSDVDLDSNVASVHGNVTSGTSAGGWSQQRYQRRRENFHLQHAKEVIAELEELMKSVDVQHLMICGDEETILPVFRPQLSKSLEEKLIGSVSIGQYESSDEIYEKTHELVANEREILEKKKIEQLNDATKSSAKMGMLGVEQTLEALANGQVEELLISSDIDSIEYSKKKIKKIVKAYEPGDDTAPAQALSAIGDAASLADQLIIRAINTAARITFVRDESLLANDGGVGAILRFSMNARASS